MRRLRPYTLLYLAGALFVCGILCLMVGIDCATKQAEAKEEKKKTTEEQIEDLEKRVKTLEKQISKYERRFQDGNYRMSEIEADHRECLNKNTEQDRRLNLGKKRMREIEECYVYLLDLIVKYHGKDGK